MVALRHQRAFNSTASVTEPTDHAGTVDAVYTVG